jgi:cell division protein ZipA
LAAELRWILLGLCVALIAAIWWWSTRRGGQAPGDSALRESTAGRQPEGRAPEGRAHDARSPDTRPPDAGSASDGAVHSAAPIFSNPPAHSKPPTLSSPPGIPPTLQPLDEDPGYTRGPQSESRDWGVPPFEPLSIRTGDYERVPVLDGPMMVNADPMPSMTAAPAPAAASTPAAPTQADARLDTPPSTETPRAETPKAETPKAETPKAEKPKAELQKIVTVRVCAADEQHWPGAQLLEALELHGLAFGRYQVFHRKHSDGRSLFCVASLIEPGTFDIDLMADQDFRGVTLFAVLPGPIAPLETLDELYATARGLAEALSGVVQDSKGIPLSMQRAAVVREDVARFQASLP